MIDGRFNIDLHLIVTLTAPAVGSLDFRVSGKDVSFGITWISGEPFEFLMKKLDRQNRTNNFSHSSAIFPQP